MDFQTRYLRYFLTVADCRSFSRAAVQLSVSQPTLSQRIQALEKQLGFALFERSGRAIELTEKGGALIEAVRALVGSANQIDRLIRDLRNEQEGPLTIGVSLYSDFPERGALLAEYTAQYPNDEIELEIGNTMSLFRGLSGGEFDMGFVTSPPPGEPYEHVVLRWFPVEIAVRIGSDLAARKEIAPEMLCGMPLATFRRKFHPLLYDRAIQPLVDLGARLAFPPDHSRPGVLAYAALHDVILPMAFAQFDDRELRDAGMVRRSLHGVDPVAGLMLIRKSGAATTKSERLWNFALSSRRAG